MLGRSSPVPQSFNLTAPFCKSSLAQSTFDQTGHHQWALGCFSKDTLKKNKMSTPPHNWGVPRKIISRRRGWSNKSRGLALALKVWPFFASFHLPPSGSVVPLAIFSSTYCFAEIKVKSWEVERSKKEMECDAEVEFLNFNYCSLPAHLLLTSRSPPAHLTTLSFPSKMVKL